VFGFYPHSEPVTPTPTGDGWVWSPVACIALSSKLFVRRIANLGKVLSPTVDPILIGEALGLITTILNYRKDPGEEWGVAS